MTVERVIDRLVGLINPDNAEEENQALGDAVQILRLIEDNHHLHIHRMRRRYRFIGDGRKSGNLPVEVE